jgi:holin-like protein
MLPAITALLVCQLIGEVIARALSLPLPGPVIGMALLLIVLVARGSEPAQLGETCDALLQHLSLLFVPAGVGVLVYLGLIADQWFAIVVALIGSTVLGLVVTALVLKALLPPLDEGAEQ